MPIVGLWLFDPAWAAICHPSRCRIAPFCSGNPTSSRRFGHTGSANDGIPHTFAGVGQTPTASPPI